MTGNQFIIHNIKSNNIILSNNTNKTIEQNNTNKPVVENIEKTSSKTKNIPQTSSITKTNHITYEFRDIQVSMIIDSESLETKFMAIKEDVVKEKMNFFKQDEIDKDFLVLLPKYHNYVKIKNN